VDVRDDLSLPFLEDLPDESATRARPPATAPTSTWPSADSSVSPACPVPAQTARALLTLARSAGARVVAGAVCGVDGDTKDGAARSHVLYGRVRQPALCVERGECPRLVEQTLAESRGAKADAARFERAAAATVPRSA